MYAVLQITITMEVQCQAAVLKVRLLMQGQYQAVLKARLLMQGQYQVAAVVLTFRLLLQSVTLENYCTLGKTYTVLKEKISIAF